MGEAHGKDWREEKEGGTYVTILTKSKQEPSSVNIGCL